MDFFALWKWKMAWIRPLADRAKKICSKESLTPIDKEICVLERLPYVNAIIKPDLPNETLTNDVISNEEKYKIRTVFINIDYPGEKGEHLLKKSFKKLWRSTNQKVNFVCRYSVTKISFFTNMKDKLNKLNKSNVAYQFS